MRRNIYLERYATSGPRISESPAGNLSIIVVIPACAEPELKQSLFSLLKCHAPQGNVEIIIVLNHSELADSLTRKANLKSCQQVIDLQAQSPKWLKIWLLKAYDLPKKHAGVGLARKIGMDEAVRRFEQLKEQRSSIHQEGVIVCFDADCTCEENYLRAIETHFKQSNTPGCSIYYEHPLQGGLYPDNIYEGIIQYEMFLRLYVDALRWAGYPYAWQTVGSAIAVRSKIYQQQGGMNLRKAGEDFYFLQKLFPLPGFSELNTTRVVPSPRVSTRVPFGTGKVMGEWVSQQKEELMAYSPNGFIALKAFMTALPALYQADDSVNFLQTMPGVVQDYLKQRNFDLELPRIKLNSASFPSFYKQLFAWFGGLKVLQFFHFARDYHPDVPVAEATRWLLQEWMMDKSEYSDDKKLLLRLREVDRQWDYIFNLPV